MIDDFAKGLVWACVGGEDILQTDLALIRDGLLKGVDEDRALTELFLLRLSLAADAAQRYFAEDVQHELRQTLGRFVHHMLMDSGERRVRANPNLMIDELNKRSNAYLSAIHAPHHPGPGSTVGKVFAKFCGHEGNSSVIMVGAIQFGRTIIAVTEFLKTCPSSILRS